MDIPAKCSDCGRSYTRYRDLRRHALKVHPEKGQLIAPSRAMTKESYQFSCPQCNKNFSHKANLKFHFKKIHGKSLTELSNQDKNVARQKCALCDFFAVYKKDFINHYKKDHDMPLDSKTMEFATMEEFVAWKDDLEKTSKSKYVKEKGCKAGVTSYICHRSGFFKSESQGKRHIKTQGSNKINGYCPAAIKVFLKTDGKCCIEFLTSHVGHQNDLGHLFLTPLERQTLATKLASKMPFEAVLDEIRDDVSNASSLARLHLLTKKDLNNIAASFNLTSTVIRHKNDAISLDAWVHEMKNDCVLFYKPQDTILENYPQLRKEDFVLIIMNKSQANIFKEYSNDCICVDGTHGVNGYQFELHTILVLDDLRQGFPCAFCISSRSDETVMTIFFESVKQNVGSLPIQCKVFMSDMSEIYYNAWSKVMTTSNFRLYCTWHVDRAWRKNLSLISTGEKQKAVYRTLRTLLQETDPSAFEVMLSNFVEKGLGDPDTVSFISYFKNNYVANSKSWAYCYRLHCRLNTNMHVERMHRSIKYIYMQGKNVKRLDKAVNALMKFIRDKLFDRLIILNKGKICSKLKELRTRHKTSETMNTGLIIKIDDYWQVPTASNKNIDVYNIYENVSQCNCQLVCSECETCIHKYSCTCLDSSIKWNMCKHIHLLCRYRKLNRPPQTSSNAHEDTNELEIVSNKQLMETETIFEEISKPSNRDVCLVEKKHELLKDLYDIVNSVENEAEFEALKKMVLPMRPTLLAVRQNSNQLPFKDTNRCPANKKIVPQRRLYSTKKKTTKKNARLLKPNPDECNSIAMNLLM